MNMMYIKYNGSKRKSIIKNDTNIIEECVDLNNNYKNSSCVIELQKYKDSKEKDLNDEITNFFLNSIHKNHLNNK